MSTSEQPTNHSVMAIGAHADDIENQAGGTLEKYFRAGYAIVYVMSTNNMSGEINWLQPDGSRSSRKLPTAEIEIIRKRECEAAASEWNTTPIHLDHPQRHYTNEALEKVELRYGAPIPANIPGSVPSILTACEDSASIDRLAALICEEKPEIILTHCLSTANPEHFCTALLVSRAFARACERGHCGALLHWCEETTLFGPSQSRWDTFIDYSPLLDRKMELIGKHECQMPHWRNPDFGHRVIAMEFGKSCGVGAAEPFIWIQKPPHGPAYGPLMTELLQNSK